MNISWTVVAFSLTSLWFISTFFLKEFDIAAEEILHLGKVSV